MRTSSFSIILLLALVPLHAMAQSGGGAPGGGAPGGGDRTLYDGVAAVVGNEIVLISDVRQRAMLFAQQMRQNPNDPALQRQILNDLIDEKLVLTRAREDSITVGDELVEQRVEYRLSELVRQAGSEAQLERTYGMSMGKIREEARELIRQQLLIQRVVQMKFSDMKVTDRDIEEFYRKSQDSLRAITVPEQIELRQIVLVSAPGEATKQGTIALLTAIRDSIVAGGDFADFARRYSEDVTAADGGELGYVRPGTFVGEFEQAASALSINQISEPVESPFGFHLIQLLDRRSDGAIRTRHILVKVAASDEERDSLMARLAEIRSRVRAGESFADIARRVSQDPETAPLGGLLGKVPVAGMQRALSGRLPAEIVAGIASMEQGAITEPFAVQLTPTRSGFAIVEVSRRIPAHSFDRDEDRAELEQLTFLDKQREGYARWLAELRREIFWEIRTDPSRMN